MQIHPAVLYDNCSPGHNSMCPDLLGSSTHVYHFIEELSKCLQVASEKHHSVTGEGLLMLTCLVICCMLEATNDITVHILVCICSGYA